jgi:geranylgeranyl reductase family protein
MKYDVIVSGLGPAGSVFLKELSGSGLKVLAIEKEEFPRRKPCAGGLTPKAYRLLKNMYPDLDKLLRFKASVMELCYKDSRVRVESREPLTYMTDREELDLFLFESIPHGEFEVHTGETVLSAQREDGEVVVKSSKGTYRGRVLVVAEGVNSRLASQFGVGRELGFTYETEVEGEERGELLVDFTGFTWGYYWIFPKGNFSSVGLGEFKNRENFKRLRELLKELNGKHKVKGKVFWERGFPIPAGKKSNDVYRSQVLFLGDSGGLVDPLTGEGIYYAAKSAILAARVIRNSLSRGSLLGLADYKDLVDRVLGEEFFWARVVGRFFFWFRGLNFFVIERLEEAGILTAKLLSGELSYREALVNYLKLAPKSLVSF